MGILYFLPALNALPDALPLSGQPVAAAKCEGLYGMHEFSCLPINSLIIFNFFATHSSKEISKPRPTVSVQHFIPISMYLSAFSCDVFTVCALSDHPDCRGANDVTEKQLSKLLLTLVCFGVSLYIFGVSKCVQVVQVTVPRSTLENPAFQPNT